MRIQQDDYNDTIKHASLQFIMNNRILPEYASYYLNKQEEKEIEHIVFDVHFSSIG